MAWLPQLKATVPEMLKAPIKQTIAHKALATTFEPVTSVCRSFSCFLTNGTFRDLAGQKNSYVTGQIARLRVKICYTLF